MATRKRKKPRRPQHKPSAASRVPSPPIGDGLVYTSYDITDEPLEDRHIKRLPSQVQARMEDLCALAQHQPAQAIPELEHLVATYPQVPTFGNYLSVAYLAAGDVEKTAACVYDTYRRHPHYLFAKINYASLCLRQGETDKIPGIFNHVFDLKLLYPQRKRFHVSEFINFAWVMCWYFCAIEERDNATLYYQMLKEVAPRHPLTGKARRLLSPPFWVRWLRAWAAKRRRKKAAMAQQSKIA